MAKLKSTYALQQKADEFDVYDLIDEIEEDILEEERRGYGGVAEPRSCVA